MNCPSYRNDTYSDWNDIFGNDYDKLFRAGMAIEKGILKKN